MHDVVITVLGLTGLLALVTLLLPLARRLNFPYTVLLAAVGIGLGMLTTMLGERDELWLLGDFVYALDSFEITAETVFFIFLPTLIFEAALHINVRQLIHDIAPILMLAIVGLLASTFVVGYSVWVAGAGVSIITCLLLGAIVSATDPVAVTALFKELGAPKRLEVLVEGESLFNDATAIVLFTILAAMLTGGRDADVLAGIGAFFTVFLGGAVVGYVSAVAVCVLIGRLHHVPLVEITLTFCLAYLSFILAEHYLHVSGVMAVVTAGLVIGSYGRTRISPSTWPALIETWEHLGFWATSLIFVLVGLAVPDLLVGVGLKELGLLAVLVVAAFAIRAIILFAFLPILSAVGIAERVSGAFTTVMLWGGLRGAVSLALALAVLEMPGLEVEVKRFVAMMVTGFALFTLFVNATSMRSLILLFGLEKLSPVDLAVRNRVTALALDNIQTNIESVAKDYRVKSERVQEITGGYGRRLAEVESELSGIEGLSHDDRVYIGLTTLADHERRLYLQQFSDDVISPDIARQLLALSTKVLDGVRTTRVDGFKMAVEKSLAFSRSFRVALYLHRVFGFSAPLVRQLENQFEILFATQSVLREHMGYIKETIAPLLDEKAAHEIQQLTADRLKKIEKAFVALKLQYPDYSDALQTRLLERLALRQEETNYHEMLEGSLISDEVFKDLKAELRQRSAALERRPVLDLGLNRTRLLTRVPFLADLPADRIAEIAKLLKPRLVVPGELIIRKGDARDAMYFIASGAVEIDLESQPVRLGTGYFFGEIALVTARPRTANVTALSYCDLLALYTRDFERLLDAHPTLRETIMTVAAERVAALDSTLEL